MMATVPHVTSGLGLRKFQADGFLLTQVYEAEDEPSTGVGLFFLEYFLWNNTNIRTSSCKSIAYTD